MKPITTEYSELMARQLRNKSELIVRFRVGGVNYTFSDEITSAKKVEDVDPLSRRLPTETFEFTIIDYDGQYDPSNPSGIWQSLDENIQLTILYYLYRDDGTRISLSNDYYYLDGKPTTSNGLVTFKASSRLRHLNKIYYKGSAGTNNFYALASDILTDAGLSLTDFDIDDALRNMTTEAPLPAYSTQNLLQMIAHATGCVLYTRNDVINIKRFELGEVTYPNDHLTLKTIAKGGDIVTKIEPLYKVSAYKYNYTESEEQTIFASVVNLDSTGHATIHADYDTATNLVIHVYQGAATTAYLYAKQADITIVGNPDGVTALEITGKKISTTTDILDVYASSNTLGGIDQENNPLITSDAIRAELANRAKNYLMLRLTHTIAYRGAPEIEALDGIIYATPFVAFGTGLVLSTELNYNGAISGKLVIKSIAESDIGGDLYDSNNTLVTDSNGEQVHIADALDYHSAYTTTQMNQFIQEVL